MQKVNPLTSKLLWLVPLLLVPSGCAALIYQVTWVRLLGLSMGATSAAVSTVLAAFFLGMAIGSYLADKISRGDYRDLKAFILIEMVIGLSGLILLPILLNLDYGMAGLGDMGSMLVIKFAASLILLALPTICMGATFPLLAAVLVRHQSEMSSELGKLYTLNTTGAVLGAILSGFVFIPLLGIDGSVYVAASLNLFVAATGYILFLKLKSNEKILPAVESPSAIKDTQNPYHFRIAIVLFCTGFVAIASEVAWTKYLSIFTGATIYGFAAILGIFLIGIALGSWATKRYIPSTKAGQKIIIRGLIALAASLLFARIALAQFPALLEYTNHLDIVGEYRQAGKYLAVFIILFPATFIFGALFPITLSLYCNEVANLQRRVGHAYAINTTGSILGSIAAGFWIIPYFGTDALLSFMIVIIILLPLLFVTKRSAERLVVLTAAGIILAGTWQLPHLDYAKLIAANPYRFDQDARDGKIPTFLFLEEGKAGVISVITYDNKKAKLQNNGIQESYLALTDDINPPFTEVLLGLMPYLLHPDPTTAFVVGYGGGNTLQALANTRLKQITVVELEPAVISAVASIYDGEIPLLQDPRIELRINDARNALLVENRNYDLIVSQPSHPWLAGAGNLFTKEFFNIASNSLNKGGIFTQWVNLFNMDATTLRSILKAYYEVFPYGFTLANTNSGDLLMFGSHQAIEFNYRRIQQRMRIPAIKKSLALVKVRRPEHLLWYFSLSRKEALFAAKDIQANSDTRIISEVRLAGISVDPDGEENPYKLLISNYSLDVLAYLEPDKAAQILYKAGHYFYVYKSTKRTQKAIEQLEKIDPLLAKRLEKNWLAWRESNEKRKRKSKIKNKSSSD